MKSENFSIENKVGYYGEFGGAFVPPQLEGNLKRLAQNFEKFKK